MNSYTILPKTFACWITLILCGCADLKQNLPAPTSTDIRVHENGWIDPANSNFHGKAIQKSGWDMSLCKSCHGLKYDGGKVNVSCLTCHTKSAGPENCTTCHGGVNAAPPNDISGNTAQNARGVGAHQIHLLGGKLSVPILCSDCHNVPPALSTVGHVDSPLPAEVVFNSKVSRTISNNPGTLFYSSSLPTVVPAPAYNADSVSCGNTYCHGNFKNGNPTFSPVWNNATGTQAACGTCHGDVNKPTLAERALPKIAALGGTHPNVLFCSLCHTEVVDSDLNIIDKSRHISGKLNLFGREIDF